MITLFFQGQKENIQVMLSSYVPGGICTVPSFLEFLYLAGYPGIQNKVSHPRTPSG